MLLTTWRFVTIMLTALTMWRLTSCGGSSFFTWLMLTRNGVHWRNVAKCEMGSGLAIEQGQG
jgi:hypothetical protein